MIVETLAQFTVALGRTSSAGVQLLGTAFAVDTNKFATAAHVTGVNDDNLVCVISKTIGVSDYQDTTDKQIKTVPVKISAYDAVRDIAIVEADTVQIKLPYVLSGSDDAPVGAAVFSLGFPHSDHGRLVLTVQHSYVGARVILGSAGVKTRHLIMNVQARPGQSGGPVFLGSSAKIVAMMIGSYAPGGGGGISLGGVDPHTLHQTTQAISVEYIRSML